jgi:hypothetical protein
MYNTCGYSFSDTEVTRVMMIRVQNQEEITDIDVLLEPKMI